MHQLAEYVLGLALVSPGMQNPEPLCPVLAGGVVVVSAAIVTGPLGRVAHRVAAGRTGGSTSG